MSSPPPPALMVEPMAEEILLRLPPDEPAYLIHAALVCKPWRRILSDRGFRRRYREFHRSAPPLVGYIQNHCSGMIPTSAASPPFSGPRPKLCRALDSRHGRVLFYNSRSRPGRLVVWDPIAGGQKYLSMPARPSTFHTAAVLCAVDGCGHLDCRGGPFRVVFVGADHVAARARVTAVSVYTSGTCQWSSPAYINIDIDVKKEPSLLIGDCLHFTNQIGDFGMTILRYDLNKHALSVIHTPLVPGTITMAAVDGGLGLVSVSDDSVFVWSLNNNVIINGAARWVKTQRLVMQLGKLLPRHPSRISAVVGSVEGTSTIFINSNVGLFTLNLKSRKVRKVGQGGEVYTVLPYTSFYIPELGNGGPSPP